MSARGISLTETMVYVAILGTIVLATAPATRFALVKLREAGAVVEEAQLARAADRLLADARGASAARIAVPGRIALVFEGREIAWSTTARGLERRETVTPGAAPGSAAAPTVYPGVALLEAGARSPRHVKATLVARRGGRRVVEAWLRAGGG